MAYRARRVHDCGSASVSYPIQAHVRRNPQCNWPCMLRHRYLYLLQDVDSANLRIAIGGAYAATTNDAHIHRRTGAAGYRHRLPAAIRLDAMKLTLTLQTDEAIALRRFANETGGGLDAAAQLAIRGGPAL